MVQPLLEGASLEEDPGLRTKWVNLLANAADPRRRRDISSAFQAVLRDLSPMNAAFLDSIYSSWMRKGNRWPYRSFSTEELKVVFTSAGLARVGCAEGSQYRFSVDPKSSDDDKLSGDLEDFNTSMDLLLRSSLLRCITETEALHLTDSHDDIAPAAGGTVPVHTTTHYELSSFGQRFVKACEPPTT